MHREELRQAFLTVEEAALLLRLKRSTAYELVRRGLIPAVRLGWFVRIPTCALLRMAEDAAEKGHMARGAN